MDCSSVTTTAGIGKEQQKQQQHQQQQQRQQKHRRHHRQQQQQQEHQQQQQQQHQHRQKKVQQLPSDRKRWLESLAIDAPSQLRPSKLAAEADQPAAVPSQFELFEFLKEATKVARAQLEVVSKQESSVGSHLKTPECSTKATKKTSAADRGANPFGSSVGLGTNPSENNWPMAPISAASESTPRRMGTLAVSARPAHFQPRSRRVSISSTPLPKMEEECEGEGESDEAVEEEEEEEEENEENDEEAAKFSVCKPEAQAAAVQEPRESHTRVASVQFLLPEEENTGCEREFDDVDVDEEGEEEAYFAQDQDFVELFCDEISDAKGTNLITMPSMTWRNSSTETVMPSRNPPPGLEELGGLSSARRFEKPPLQSDAQLSEASYQLLLEVVEARRSRNEAMANLAPHKFSYVEQTTSNQQGSWGEVGAHHRLWEAGPAPPGDVPCLQLNSMQQLRLLQQLQQLQQDGGCCDKSNSTNSGSSGSNEESSPKSSGGSAGQPSTTSAGQTSSTTSTTSFAGSAARPRTATSTTTTTPTPMTASATASVAGSAAGKASSRNSRTSAATSATSTSTTFINVSSCPPSSSAPTSSGSGLGEQKAIHMKKAVCSAPKATAVPYTSLLGHPTSKPCHRSWVEGGRAARNMAFPPGSF